MKKMLALLLCVAMLLSVTAAFAEDVPKYINDNASTLTGNVRLLTAYGGSIGTDALIADFNQYYPNVTVTYEVYTNNSDGNLTANAAIQAGKVDVIASYDASAASFRWENGMLLDITDLLAADGLDLVKEWGTDAYTYEGRCYYFPCAATTIFIAINMTAWEEAGLGELPKSWTWDEYLEACRKMTKRDENGNVVVYGGTDFNQRQYWVNYMRQTKGVDAYYTADGKADFTSGLAAKILQRELDAEAEGIWYPKINLITNSTKSRDLLWTGEAASCVESILTRFVTDLEKYPHDFILGYAPIPVNEEGEYNYTLAPLPTEGYSVTANAQDPDAAYAFAKFASTYGSKYMYSAGHASTWTGCNPDEVVDLVFGSAENAAKYVDVDSYIEFNIAAGNKSYVDVNITAYNAIATLVDEYTDYILSGEMTVEEGLEQLNAAADEAIADAM